VTEVPKEALQEAIHNLHGCESTWRESVPVKEVSQGQTLWQGVVQVFELHGHPTTNRCHAWSYAAQGSEKRHFVAGPHQGLLDSPERSARTGTVKEA